jgi:hypothetical protein
MYSVRYYPRFHINALGLGTYYLWIRGYTSILKTEIHIVIMILRRHSAVFRGVMLEVSKLPYLFLRLNIGTPWRISFIL